MPSSDTSPNFAIFSEFDARPYTSTLYTRQDPGGGTVNVSLPSASRIVFEDAVQFLNGLGQSPTTSVKAYLEAVLNAEADTFTVGVSTSDKLFIHNDSGNSLAYTAPSAAASQLGLVAQTAIVSDGQLDFPYDWSRTPKEITSTADQVALVINTDLDVARVPHIPYVQSIPSLFRERQGIELNCLEIVEEYYFYSGTGAIPAVCWVVNADGKVVQYVNKVLNPNATTFAWVDTNFRDRLGFNGTEVWTLVNATWSKLTANRPLPGALFPSRPLSDNHLKFSRVSNPRRKLGGGYVSNFLGNYVSHMISFYLDGPADQKDEYNHFVFTCGEYFYAGASITFYQDWGDTRTSIREVQISASQPRYDLVFTGEKDGRYGRIKGTLVSMPDDLAFPEGLRRRIPITLEIERL